jgi:hypothetical protein
MRRSHALERDLQNTMMSMSMVMTMSMLFTIMRMATIMMTMMQVAMIMWTMSHHRHHGLPCPSYLPCPVFGCTFLFSIISDRYRCIWAIAFFSDVIDACVFGLYAQRSLSLHSGVGAVTCISDVYRCFHDKVARTAIGIAACMLILRATCCLEFFGPRIRNMFVLTLGGWFLVV